MIVASMDFYWLIKLIQNCTGKVYFIFISVCQKSLNAQRSAYFSHCKMLLSAVLFLGKRVGVKVTFAACYALYNAVKCSIVS